MLVAHLFVGMQTADAQSYSDERAVWINAGSGIMLESAGPHDDIYTDELVDGISGHFSWNNLAVQVGFQRSSSFKLGGSFELGPWFSREKARTSHLSGNIKVQEKSLTHFQSFLPEEYGDPEYSDPEYEPYSYISYHVAHLGVGMKRSGKYLFEAFFLGPALTWGKQRREGEAECIEDCVHDHPKIFREQKPYRTLGLVGNAQLFLRVLPHVKLGFELLGNASMMGSHAGIRFSLQASSEK